MVRRKAFRGDQIRVGSVKRWHRVSQKDLVLFLALTGVARGEEIPEYQYEFGDIKIPLASASEPKRREASTVLALRYVEEGTAAWMGSHKCVTCHTTGTYLAMRPWLSRSFGAPKKEVHEFFVELLTQDGGRLGGERPMPMNDSQRIYIARGLAEWGARSAAAGR